MKSSSSIAGPQIILSVYGTDFFGNIVIVGYAACHVPITPGTHTRRYCALMLTSISVLHDW